MHTIEKSIEVDVPVRVAYDQWTQFERFPEFMEGVQVVRQTDDKTLDWLIEIGGKKSEFQAEIVEQEPDRVVAWRSIRGRQHAGSVRFDELGPERCLVRMQVTYDLEGVLEKVGDMIGVLDRRVAGDLKRFKSYIEERKTATGAWRNRIEGGRIGRAHDDRPMP